MTDTIKDTFTFGTIVRLKSGGPLMTVTVNEGDDGMLTLSWFDCWPRDGSKSVDADNIVWGEILETQLPSIALTLT